MISIFYILALVSLTSNINWQRVGLTHTSLHISVDYLIFDTKSQQLIRKLDLIGVWFQFYKRRNLVFTSFVANLNINHILKCLYDFSDTCYSLHKPLYVFVDSYYIFISLDLCLIIRQLNIYAKLNSFSIYFVFNSLFLKYHI